MGWMDMGISGKKRKKDLKKGGARGEEGEICEFLLPHFLFFSCFWAVIQLVVIESVRQGDLNKPVLGHFPHPLPTMYMYVADYLQLSVSYERPMDLSEGLQHSWM